MQTYFFPCIGLIPPVIEHALTSESISLRRVSRTPNTFDCATIGTKHDVQFQWNWLEIFVGNAQAEIEIRGKPSLEDAQRTVRILQAMLYLEGLAPFSIPIVTTRSISDYAGLNARDSNVLRAKLSPSEQAGFRSEDGTISFHLHDPTMMWIGSESPSPFETSCFSEAASSVGEWQALEAESPSLAAARHALLIAPSIYDVGSSLLMCWQGIESLFPSISTEVRFRLALMLAQLARPLNDAGDTYLRAKQNYNVRSRVAHGNFKKLSMGDWVEAWNLLSLALQGAKARKHLPSEDQLTIEMLRDSQVDENSVSGAKSGAID